MKFITKQPVRWYNTAALEEWLSNHGMSEKCSDSVGNILQPLLNYTLNSSFVTKYIYGRRELVKLDRWDTWNMDSTLAHIVHPMLIQLKETKHGAPMVDDEDVPDEIKSTVEPAESDDDVDGKHFDRWDYVLDEMIFAFNSKLIDWEDQFHEGVSDLQFVPIDEDGNPVNEDDAEFFEMTRGPKDTHKFDIEGYTEYNKRVSNGFRLFGRYYEGLWD